MKRPQDLGLRVRITHSGDGYPALEVRANYFTDGDALIGREGPIYLAVDESDLTMAEARAIGIALIEWADYFDDLTAAVITEGRTEPEPYSAEWMSRESIRRHQAERPDSVVGPSYE